MEGDSQEDPQRENKPENRERLRNSKAKTASGHPYGRVLLKAHTVGRFMRVGLLVSPVWRSSVENMYCRPLYESLIISAIAVPKRFTV